MTTGTYGRTDSDALRIFRGPNGWYVAEEADDGSHHQPSDGGLLTEEEALAELADLREHPEKWSQKDKRLIMAFTPFDTVANGVMRVHLYAVPTTGANNDPSTEATATVVGLNAARAWLDAHGGYASLQANYAGAQVTGWSIYRVYPGYGHRCAGSINPEI